jgi:hypothetical protein
MSAFDPKRTSAGMVVAGAKRPERGGDKAYALAGPAQKSIPFAHFAKLRLKSAEVAQCRYCQRDNFNVLITLRP